MINYFYIELVVIRIYFKSFKKLKKPYLLLIKHCKKLNSINTYFSKKPVKTVNRIFKTSSFDY